eukprot:scaffold226857_cov27-Tisochrysis_lutea.AAC.5
MVTLASLKRRWTAIAITWALEWRMRNSCSELSLVGNTMGLVCGSAGSASALSPPIRLRARRAAGEASVRASGLASRRGTADHAPADRASSSMDSRRAFMRGRRAVRGVGGRGGAPPRATIATCTAGEGGSLLVRFLSLGRKEAKRLCVLFSPFPPGCFTRIANGVLPQRGASRRGSISPWPIA